MGLLTSKSIIGEFIDTFKYSILNRGGQDKQFNIFFIKDSTSKPQKILETGEAYWGSGTGYTYAHAMASMLWERILVYRHFIERASEDQFGEFPVTSSGDVGGF